MVTAIVFAELYREEPLVRGTNLSKFVLLFSSADNNVRLRGTWDPQRDPADFALLVQEVVSQEGTAWVVRTHSESPQDCVKRLHHGHDVEVVPAGDAPVAIQSPGEVLSFTFSPIVMQKEIGMALFKSEEDSLPPQIGSFFERLPTEVKCKIFRRLPWTVLAYTMPFVSMWLFDFVKKGTNNFSVLDFRHAFPTSEDLTAICSVATESCKKLLPMNRSFAMMPWFVELNDVDVQLPTTDLSGRLFVDNRWPNVKSIEWERDIDEDLDPFSYEHIPRLFGGSLESLRFPNLTVLKLDLEDVSLSWGVFDGCVLAVLEDLDVRLPSNMENSKLSTFQASFPELKRLAIEVAYAYQAVGRVFPEVASARESMPMLELLALHSLGEFKVLSIEESLRYFYGVPASIVWLSGISRKLLGYPPAIDLEAINLQGSWIMKAFPRVEQLQVGELLRVNWDETSLVQLLQLKDIRVMWTGQVPFEKMENLESCLLSYPLITRTFDQESFNVILRNPVLERLCFPWRRVGDFLGNVPQGFTDSAVEHLEICCLRTIDDQTLQSIGGMLKSFPNVSCLKLDTELVNFYGPEVFISSMSSRLVHVEINLIKKPFSFAREECNSDLSGLEREMNRHFFFVLRRLDDSSKKEYPRHVDHQDCFMKPFFSMDTS